MEKLVDLLNQYEQERHETSVKADIRTHKEHLNYLGMNWNYSELLCISKRYGFIEWLVKNDKVKTSFNCAVSKDNDYLEREINSDYETLLMLLATQDNVIDFLINILK